MELSASPPVSTAQSGDPATPVASELGLVRSEVKNVLDQSDAWKRLSGEDRKAFAANMVKVSSFLADDPGWLESDDPPQSAGLAEASNPIADLKKRLAGKPGHIGEEFDAGAMRQGVEEFGNLVKTVDFPEFVSGLIQGVFQAIVDASIQQMEAYGELLAATSKAVDQFASDHITDDQAREQVASRFPSLVRVERTEDGGQRLAPASDDVEDTSALQDFARSSETFEFDDNESERKFVAAAKLELARQRQKLMAMMVMLGINRIIVTNGRINAKVIFDIEASDYAKRQARASMTDTAKSDSMAGGGFVTPWGGGGGYSRKRHNTTVRSSIDDSSESAAQMKAQLTGEVRVNFRSETMSPERMLDALQYEQMNFLSTPGATEASHRGSGPSPPPAPPAGGNR